MDNPMPSAAMPSCDISTDITEHKQTQEVRERLIAELEAKNAELERFTYTDQRTRRRG